MKKPLIIIGAGNVGGFIAYNIHEFGDYDLLGFLDDDVSKHGNMVYGLKVLGGIDSLKNYLKQEVMSIIVGISSPSAKESVLQRLSGFKLSYPTFIARTAWLSKEVTVGNGSIIYPGVSINYQTTIGDFVIMNMNCAIGHDCTIERFATLAPGVNLGGFSYLEEGVEIGIGAATKQRIRIGKYSIIGGQSMLVRDVLPFTKVAGVPGKQLK